MNLSFRPATPADDPFLLELFRAAHPEFESWPLPDAQKLFLIQTQFELQSMDYLSRYPGSVHEIILENAVPIGRIWRHTRADSIHILDFSLSTGHRNRGIGTWLMENIKSEAATQGKAVTTTVQRMNSGSLRWQERMGFRIASEDQVNHFLEWRPENLEQHR